MIDHEIQVDLGERSYPIYVGTHTVSTIGPICKRHNLPRQLVLITDRIVGGHYLRSVMRALRAEGFEVVSIVVPSGEKQKSLSRANSIFTFMLKRGIGRKSAVLALGGGVIGDLAGFIAATFHRGLPLVQIPTTLLAQVDSSIGGKTAVNHPFGKNMIGAFHQPAFVWSDADVLATLPRREVVCGIGEIIKYGVIADEGLFSYVETHLESILALRRDAVMHVQNACSALKAGLVALDEREQGKRIILNFGHTLGHAYEAAGKFRALKHGEAVLLGMVGESWIAREMSIIDAGTHDRLLQLIRRVPLKHKVNKLNERSILNALGRDKKAVSGKKRFVLPIRIGDTTVTDAVPPTLVRKSLQYVIESIPPN